MLEELALEDGDELRVRLVSVDEATPPAEDVATDSEEHVAAQALYEAEIASNPPEASKLERKRPDASLELVVNEDTPIVADLSEERDLLTLSSSWNSWHPERWRVSLTSCSCEEAIEKKGGKDWFVDHVGQGDLVTVRVGNGLGPARLSR